MKKTILILVIFILTFIPIISYSNPKGVNEDSIKVCKVLEIKKAKKQINNTNKAYIILIQDTISKEILTLVSLKVKHKSSIKLKVGNCYKFILEQYFEYDYVIQIGLKLSVTLNGVLVNIPSSFYTPNIYTTPNLKGLYYTSP